MAVKDAEIALSPGFRWGTSLLPGEVITMEQVMDWSAITYPHTTVNELSGDAIKTILEDVCDNLFNPDPYYQQGGDMVRVGGDVCSSPAHRWAPHRRHAARGKPIEAAKTYKVGGRRSPRRKGEPAWEVISQYLRDRKSIAAPKLNLPKLVGVEGNPGIA
jgi:sulfur-oxidizing protein SoxB